MRVAIQADDGDEVSIIADFISVEQALVTLEIDNPLYDQKVELESVSLSVDKARELARALWSVTDALVSVTVFTPQLQSTNSTNIGEFGRFSGILNRQREARRI